MNTNGHPTRGGQGRFVTKPPHAGCLTVLAAFAASVTMLFVVAWAAMLLLGALASMAEADRLAVSYESALILTVLMRVLCGTAPQVRTSA